ncbi:sulfotransferase [Paraliomyxa miuraensis]|nr:sulfotransferase [Paraliomyxa miuraensis]
MLSLELQPPPATWSGSAALARALDAALDEHPPAIQHIPTTPHEGRVASTAVFFERAPLDALLARHLELLRAWPDAALHHRVYGREIADRLHAPVVIISPPRSGSTLLYELATSLPEVHGIGSESYHVIDRLQGLALHDHGHDSHVLTAADASPPIITAIRVGFAAGLRDRDDQLVFGPRGDSSARTLRLVEKTPRNCLRVPFLRRAFPDARFVFLFREPRAVLSSIMEKWRRAASTGFNVRLPGWPGGEHWPPERWLGLVPPGWRALAGASLVEVAALKWTQATLHMLTAMDELPADQRHALRFDELVADPLGAIETIAAFAGLSLDERARQRCTPPLPQSAATVTPPEPGKWRRDETALMRVLPTLRPLIARVESRVGRFERS